ncbi:MAG: hypothetical protein Q8N48_00340 [Thiobacillus sp.]|nr:hypothetical protein [Thiobacillus sp.]MDP2977260.1 hypothetical protein [Thiobacillus sp.]
MREIHFIVEEAPEGGYVARAVVVDIDDRGRRSAQPACQVPVRDAVRCHFDEEQVPGLIRPHITREEVLAT